MEHNEGEIKYPVSLLRGILFGNAYAVQHPPHIEHQLKLNISKRLIAASIQSVVIHLVGLYFACEKNDAVSGGLAMNNILANMNREKKEFQELKPPESLGEIKVNDVRRAVEEKELSLEEYTDLAYKWAQSAWNAWSVHHQAIRDLVEKYNKTLKK